MNAHFILRSEPSRLPSLDFMLETPGIFLLGRSSQCHFVVKDDTVSRLHAEISIAEGSITLRDLGSRNGIFVNARRVQKGTLQDGQSIRFGDATFLLIKRGRTFEEPESDIETARGGRVPSPCGHHAELSKAQGVVLDLVLEGLSEKKMAAQLKLSTATIHNHIQAIYRIFKVHSRAELLALFLAGNEARTMMRLLRSTEAGVAE